MLYLKTAPTLQDFQQYVVSLEEERGFSDQTPIEKCLMLGEEVGELFKSVRNHEKIKVDKTSKISPVGEELADCFIMLLAVANHLNIDLEKEFRNKEEINKTRIWR